MQTNKKHKRTLFGMALLCHSCKTCHVLLLPAISLIFYHNLPVAGAALYDQRDHTTDTVEKLAYYPSLASAYAIL